MKSPAFSFMFIIIYFFQANVALFFDIANVLFDFSGKESPFSICFIGVKSIILRSIVRKNVIYDIKSNYFV